MSFYTKGLNIVTISDLKVQEVKYVFSILQFFIVYCFLILELSDYVQVYMHYIQTFWTSVDIRS